eukprot:g1705.t1
MSGGRFGYQPRRGGNRDRGIVDSIREATGASEEDIHYHLHECGGDVNKATERLIDCKPIIHPSLPNSPLAAPFILVQSKKTRPKIQNRGRGRGRGRREISGVTRRGNETEPHGGKFNRRNGQNSRTRMHRGRDKSTPVTKDDTTVTENHKDKKPPAPVPMKKAYLEALCRRPKLQSVPTPTKVENGAESGWEEASPPPESVLHPVLEASLLSEEVVIPTEESVPSVEDDNTESVELNPGCDNFDNSFPIPMQDIRFTREDTTPIGSYSLPIPIRLDLKSSIIPVLNADPLDMSDIQYLFGTFSGLVKTTAELDEVSNEDQPEPSTTVLDEEDPPSAPVVQVEEQDSPVDDEGTRTEAQELAESLTAISGGLRPAQQDLDTRIQTPVSVEFLSSTSEPQINPSTLPLEVITPYNTNTSTTTSPAVEYRVEVGGGSTQVLDVEVTSPSSHEKTGPGFLTNEVQNSPVVVHEEQITTSSSNQEKANLPASVQVLEEPDYAAKNFRATTELKSMDLSLAEDLTTNPTNYFDTSTTDTRHKTQSIVESKVVMETEPSSSYTISSGPTPTLPNYQPQSRHQPPPSHKIPEKSVQSVGGGSTGVTTGHQNPKYSSHQGGPGGNNPVPSGGGGGGGTPSHVPGTLTPNNNSSGGNPSLPMMPQLPFVNPGIMPNPGMPFPPGHPYYPQYMQYQHQMYHGMYAGTYGGFGAPFNHDSVAHPAHVNPPGVPPNQGNQQFPVSFPNALYTLGGNTVYDVTGNNPNSFTNTKEKESVFLAQQQQLQHGFPGGHQPVPRNDGSLFYGVPSQAAFTQGIRTQYHQPPGFAGQFPGGGVVAPPPNYHPPGQQGNNFRL